MKNCLTYALGKWLREGGYLLCRKSMLARFHGVGPYHPFQVVPHFLHMDRSGRITQLKRTQEEERKALDYGPLKDWLWLWHFDGEVVEGDPHYQE